MTGLRQAAIDYVALRRALGFKLRGHDRLLADFIDYLDQTGETSITTAAAVTWATSPDVSAVRRAQRLSVVRGFARHRRCLDPATEVPPADAVVASRQRPTARLFSDDDIATMLAAAAMLRPRLRALTYATFFGLLAATGMRVGEGIGLNRADVDLQAGTIAINDTKFRKHRFLPLHPTTAAALASYAQVRDQTWPVPKSPAFFVSTRGTRLQGVCVHKAFNTVIATTGVWDEQEGGRARVHGFRHSFAVATLRDWYRQGDDPAARMPTLSAYLGHADPAYTYWYLQACPDLLGLAADRLDLWEHQR